MNELETEGIQQRLIKLLAPIHEESRATARRLCRSNVDGDDLFHEAVLHAFDKVHLLRDTTRFRSWFFAVLLSVHRNRARRDFWRRFASLDSDPEASVPLDKPFPTPWEETSEHTARIRKALCALPAVQREAVVLFEVNGFSIEEIAVMQRTSLSAVKSRLSRGRARLRLHYQRLVLSETDPLARGKQWLKNEM